MANLKTAGVKALVDEVIGQLPRPLNEHVTLEVFKAIEASPRWLVQYRTVCGELGQPVVNSWIGQWALRNLGAAALQRGVEASGGTTLTKTYSTLGFS